MTLKLLPSIGGHHQPRCILHGMGGTGKTQLSTHWIREHEKNFNRVIFVDATSKRQLEADLRRAIRVVGPEYANIKWEDAIAYLDGKEKGWLLFFDNADSPELNLDPYLPSSIHGSILITTRNQGCKAYAPDGAIYVSSLSESEAVDLLHSIANVTPASNDVSMEIVKELGMLALAVTQAGAYIFKTRRLSSYLNTLQSHRDRLLREDPLKGTKYPYSTYAAFDLSFHQLPSNAQELLRICAYLHPSGIPMALFEYSTTSDFTAHTVLESWPPPKSDEVVISDLKRIIGQTWDEVSFQELVEAGQRASFIYAYTDEAGGLFYSVHPLLQRYIRDSLGVEIESQYASMASQLLLGATRPIEASNIWYRQLLPHIDALPQSVKVANITHALVFYQVYESSGDWKACKGLLEFALSKIREIYGPLHEDSILVTRRLAKMVRRCGQLEEAERLEKDLLDNASTTSENAISTPYKLWAVSQIQYTIVVSWRRPKR